MWRRKKRVMLNNSRNRFPIYISQYGCLPTEISQAKTKEVIDYKCCNNSRPVFNSKKREGGREGGREGEGEKGGREGEKVRKDS